VRALGLALLAVLAVSFVPRSGDRYTPPLLHHSERRAERPGSPATGIVRPPAPGRLAKQVATSPRASAPAAVAREAPVPRESHGDAAPPRQLSPDEATAVGARTPAEDLAYLNGAPGAAARLWDRIPPDELSRLEARLRRELRGGDDFISIPLPRLAATGPAADREAAQAARAYRQEAAVVDVRLFRKVTLALKATALADLCERLRAETGIAMTAGRSVADEKVTVFCKEMPLREVMRQLSRPFGYTWLRSGKEGEYRYELTQDLRSQLLEEELRSRDRNAALLDVDREMTRYRRYLDLTPDEALARSRTAAPGEKEVLAHLGSKGWGPAQIYFRLSPQDLAALRAGRELIFAAEPGPGEQPLPPEMARHVITSLRDYRIVRRAESYDVGTVRSHPDGALPSAVPEARARVSLRIDANELGQLTLTGLAGFSIGAPPRMLSLQGDGERNLAIGISPAVRNPQNAVVNAKYARDSGLGPRVNLRVRPDLHTPPAPVGDTASPPNVTTADALEALHRITGLPIVADFYTRLYRPEAVSVERMPLFDALNHLADTMRLRWSRDGEWVLFRSAGFFHDRLKEVPNRLLERWAASRREHGALTLDDLIEIAQLTDAQLNAATMAEGARQCFGLAEWDLARNSLLRPHLRYLATLAPGQRQEAQRGPGLAFTKLLLAQQQGFLSLALGSRPGDAQPNLEELSGATLRVEYSLPGGYRWSTPARPGSQQWISFEPALVREQSREAALQSARRIDPQAAEAQIVLTELSMLISYSLDGTSRRFRPGGVRATPSNTFSGFIRAVEGPDG
jgi:hypothetical protein